MKKFYNEVTIGEVRGGFSVNLDGKPIKTPKENFLVIPYNSLAKEIAAEWMKQGDVISFNEMIMTKFVYTILDQLYDNDNNEAKVDITLGSYIVGRCNWQERALGYLKSDCLLYVESEPKELKVLEEYKWLPLINEFNKDFSCELQFVENFSPSISQSVVDKTNAYLSKLNEWQLFVFVLYVSQLDSFLLAYFLYNNKISDDYALELSYLHENFQNSIWGIDETSFKEKQEVLQTIKNITKFKNLII